MKRQERVFQRLIWVIIAVLSVWIFVSFPAYAEEETETAGSSLGKEVLEKEIEGEDFDAYSDGPFRAARAVGWVKNSVGWRYYDSSGQYLRSRWYKHTDGYYYWFEADGYMATGWRKVQGSWHYFTSNGYWIDQSKYSRYENGTLKGVDVSKWQGDINWQSVKQDGIQFAFVRLGYTVNYQNLDPYYEKNMREAKAAGIPVGVYYYSKATTVETAIKEAQFTIDHMSGYLVSYPVVIDIEDAVQQNLGKDKLAEIIKAFCNEIRAAGYTPMLYTNENWYRNYINMNALSGEEFWIARYNYYYDTAIPRGIWQSSSESRVNGISGNVDIDFGYKDYTKIVTPRTEAISGYTKSGGRWMEDSIGKWYQYNGGGYPANKWERISGKWYWFDKRGYMTTGWQEIYGLWYYMDNTGVMQTGWQDIGRNRYYLSGSGAMVADSWFRDSGKWYYLSSSGAMVKGWLKLGSGWYYLNSTGVMQTGWQRVGSSWYYLNGSGVMQTGWQKIGGAWYYLNSSGVMLTGWQKLWGTTWYYMNSSGVMQTGWQNIGRSRYYLNSSGAMVTGWLQTGGKRYYLNNAGVMLTGRQYIDGKYYYFESDGSLR